MDIFVCERKKRDRNINQCSDVIYLYFKSHNDNSKKKLWHEECWVNDCHKTGLMDF